MARTRTPLTPASRDRQNKYHSNWEKENIRRVIVKMNRNTDADILEWIESQSNAQGAIKELIREHLKTDLVK